MVFRSRSAANQRRNIFRWELLHWTRILLNVSESMQCRCRRKYIRKKCNPFTWHEKDSGSRSTCESAIFCTIRISFMRRVSARIRTSHSQPYILCRAEHDKRDWRRLSNVQLSKNYTFVSDVAVVAVAITFRNVNNEKRIVACCRCYFSRFIGKSIY